MIDTIGGVLLMVTGIVAVAYAISRSVRPFVQLVIYLAGMAVTLAVLIAYTRSVR